MSRALVIVFVKNLEIGTVKTRLAKTIGDYGAYEVYSELVKLTEHVTLNLEEDIRVYFSQNVVSELWSNTSKHVQLGDNLGDRMLNAFRDGFNLGYDKIVLIGSDLPDLNKQLIERAISSLDNNDVVFGPADDGGYYLIGMNTLIPNIFKDKPWSQPNLLKVSIEELDELNRSVATLENLNDIDTFEDLIDSSFYKSNLKLQEKIQQLND
ncbi:TIGR04282 family arsenosugar biosynthesis glycosyltransferase [Winogradskyella sp. DF17]|uniref:TIGR04282 family arsenosugar biosynthesis glycosyltransferase n=1 Tax=Winogradskyella pelagia TaxID=2819984 RepID=A0ABS3T1V9_9FLAO|nr:TIGR04282 family arsenosugar biosynthesis glycosyltransferase [Winogradskyella sp. DF17]MBO3115705.1 TIGR04282 family arsenosugar biosynthesis glycosyltransferase [Winogradskyella sp. DF17]